MTIGGQSHHPCRKSRWPMEAERWLTCNRPSINNTVCCRMLPKDETCLANICLALLDLLAPQQMYCKTMAIQWNEYGIDLKNIERYVGIRVNFNNLSYIYTLLQSCNIDAIDCVSLLCISY